jgi:hypothetical protein
MPRRALRWENFLPEPCVERALGGLLSLHRCRPYCDGWPPSRWEWPVLANTAIVKTAMIAARINVFIHFSITETSRNLVCVMLHCNEASMKKAARRTVTHEQHISGELL